VIDAHVTSHGALTLSGLVAIAIGLITLFHKAPAPYHTSIPLVVTLTVLVGGFWAIALTKAITVRRSPVSMGPQDIVGMEGVARSGGYVLVRGELWHARSGDRLDPGARVRVDGLDGLTLDVHRIEA